MRDELLIRDMQAGEEEAVGAVIRAAYAEYESAYAPDNPEVWARFMAIIGNVEAHAGKAEVIVAEHDGRIAGTVTFYRDASQSGQGDWPPGSAGIVRLAVTPEARGGGIARALTQECVRRSRDAGVETLALHTAEWMPIARAMYERMGFVRCPEYDFHAPSGAIGLGYRLELKRQQ